MNKIKTSMLLAVIGLSTLFNASCSKDEKDNCNPPPVEENIVGKWHANLSDGDVEFKADGTYIDDDETLFGLEVNGLKYTQRTYTINDNVLRLKISPPTTNDSSVFEMIIKENKCNQIKLSIDFFGEEFIETMNRK